MIEKTEPALLSRNCLLRKQEKMQVEEIKSSSKKQNSNRGIKEIDLSKLAKTHRTIKDWVIPEGGFCKTMLKKDESSPEKAIDQEKVKKECKSIQRSIKSWLNPEKRNAINGTTEKKRDGEGRKSKVQVETKSSEEAVP